MAKIRSNTNVNPGFTSSDLLASFLELLATLFSNLRTFLLTWSGMYLTGHQGLGWMHQQAADTHRDFSFLHRSGVPRESASLDLSTEESHRLPFSDQALCQLTHGLLYHGSALPCHSVWLVAPIQ